MLRDPRVRRLLAACGVALTLALSEARAQTPLDRAFTYQGQLRQNGQPVSGNVDFLFTLWDASSGGNQVGVALGITNAAVTRGLLTADLDFGSGTVNGDGRWIQIAVRNPAGSGG